MGRATQVDFGDSDELSDWPLGAIRTLLHFLGASPVDDEEHRATIVEVLTDSKWHELLENGEDRLSWFFETSRALIEASQFDALQSFVDTWLNASDEETVAACFADERREPEALVGELLDVGQASFARDVAVGFITALSPERLWTFPVTPAPAWWDELELIPRTSAVQSTLEFADAVPSMGFFDGLSNGGTDFLPRRFIQQFRFGGLIAEAREIWGVLVACLPSVVSTPSIVDVIVEGIDLAYLDLRAGDLEAAQATYGLVVEVWERSRASSGRSCGAWLQLFASILDLARGDADSAVNRLTDLEDVAALQEASTLVLIAASRTGDRDRALREAGMLRERAQLTFGDDRGKFRTPEEIVGWFDHFAMVGVDPYLLIRYLGFVDLALYAGWQQPAEEIFEYFGVQSEFDALFPDRVVALETCLRIFDGFEPPIDDLSLQEVFVELAERLLVRGDRGGALAWLMERLDSLNLSGEPDSDELTELIELIERAYGDDDRPQFITWALEQLHDAGPELLGVLAVAIARTAAVGDPVLEPVTWEAIRRRLTGESTRRSSSTRLATVRALLPLVKTSWDHAAGCAQLLAAVALPATTPPLRAACLDLIEAVLKNARITLDELVSTTLLAVTDASRSDVELGRTMEVTTRWMGHGGVEASTAVFDLLVTKGCSSLDHATHEQLRSLVRDRFHELAREHRDRGLVFLEELRERVEASTTRGGCAILLETIALTFEDAIAHGGGVGAVDRVQTDLEAYGLELLDRGLAVEVLDLVGHVLAVRNGIAAERELLSDAADDYVAARTVYDELAIPLLTAVGFAPTSLPFLKVHAFGFEALVRTGGAVEGQINQTLEWLDVALGHAGDEVRELASVAVQVGWTLAHLGKFKEVLELLERVQRLEINILEWRWYPLEIEVKNLTAWCLVQTNQWSQADRLIEELIGLAMISTSRWTERILAANLVNLGLSRLAARRFDLAVREADRVIKLHGDYDDPRVFRQVMEAYRLRCRALLSMDDAAAVAATIQALEELPPGDPSRSALTRRTIRDLRVGSFLTEAR